MMLRGTAGDSAKVPSLTKRGEERVRLIETGHFADDASSAVPETGTVTAFKTFLGESE